MKCAFAFVAVFLGLGPGLGQARSAPPQNAAPDPSSGETVHLTIRPAAAPVPALKYRLLPELGERHPGNAVFLYYRAFSPEWAGILRRPEVSRQIEKWADNMRQVPDQQMRWVLNDHSLKEIDRGARRTYADWEMADRVREEGMFLLLPDIQSFRTYGNLLAMRARLQMADGKLDQAAYTLETGLSLGRDVAKGPTLVQGLVGIAVTEVMLEQTEEFIQTPKSPNLYWALTQLPTPFADLRNGYGGERLMIDNLFPGMRRRLQNPGGPPMSEAEARALIDRLAAQLKGLSLTPRMYDWRARMGLALLAAQAYPRARRFFLDQGWPARKVDAMPVLQVALMYEVYNYDRLFDEMVKWTVLPYGQARAGLEQAEQELRRAKAAGPQTGTTLATLLLPAMQKVSQATARTERHIAALRCIEAIRLYAAAHDGQLPGRLEDIKEVPVPRDPVTGGAFEYTATGDRATLSWKRAGPNEANLNVVRRYELTLRR